MSESDQNRSTRLLSDTPADADSFEGGHERVAEAIAGLIQDEEGGKAIALSGPYGSGKSTVVRLLKNEMHDIDQAEKEDTRIFTYDAWEHQGDPLRRSFIEGLIEFLRDPDLDWAESGSWEDEKERLARRKEITKIDTEPKLTTWGRWVAVSLFFTPLGLLLTNNFIRDDNGGLQTSGLELAIWIVGIITIFTPIFIIVLAFLYGSDPFYVLVKKTSQEEETKTIRTPDPTTIEFQEVFRKIVSDTLCNSKRQLIVVVDNLDRLSAERALSTWATMRTFFDSKDENEPGWMSRFWLIVPLNFGALEETFEEHKVDGEKRKDVSGVPAEVESDQQNSDRETNNGKQKYRTAERLGKSNPLRAFADKTFNTVFRVAPPVLSDWEKFMKEQLAEAFDLDTSASESKRAFHAVYRVYRAEATRGNGIPTPRDIKVFINHLSALYRQWGHEISLPTLAAYQLVSRNISPSGAELLQPDRLLVEDIRRELRGKDWQEELAALHFNVHPDRAIEVLIGEKVQTALERGNREALKEHSQIRGFESILDTTLSLVISEKNPSTVALSAFALEGITIEDTSVGERAWRQLRSVTINAEDWYPDEEKKGEGFIYILNKTSKDERDKLIESIIRSACNCKLKEVGYYVDLTSEVKDWTDGMLPIVSRLRNNNLLHYNFHTPPDWPSFIGVLAHLSAHESASELAYLFTPAPVLNEDKGGIDEAVANLLKDGGALQSAHVRGIRLMKHIDGVGTNSGWDSTSERLQEALSWNADVETDYQYSCLELALVIEEEILGQQRSSIGNYLSSNQGRADIFHHLDQHRNEKDAFSALCFLVRLLYNVTGNRGSRNGSAPQGHNFFKQVLQKPDHPERTFFVGGIADLVEKFDIINGLLEVADHDIANGFIAEVVCILSERDSGSEIFTCDVICDHADKIGKALDKSEEHAEAFQELIIHADSEGELSAKLQEVGQDEWLTKLKNDSKLVKAVLTLASEAEIRLSVDFKDALLEHAVWAIEEGHKSQQVGADKGSQILSALSPDAKKSFLKSLQRKLIGKCSDLNITTALLMYETALQESEAIGDVKIVNPDSVVNENFSGLIDAGNAEELKWLHHVLQAKPNLKSDIDESTWKTFRETVRTKGSRLNGEAASQIREIAKTIGVELDDPDNDEQGDGSQQENKP